MSELAIDALRPSDIDARVAWMNDTTVRAGLNIAGPIDSHSSQQWYSRVSTDPSRRDLVLRLGGDPVGMSGLTGINEEHGHAELYAFVDPGRKRRGFGSQLVSDTCRVAFEELDLHRVFLWMFASNDAAASLYAKEGFKLEGVLREHAFRDGQLVDRHVMGLLRSEWASQRNSSRTQSGT